MVDGVSCLCLTYGRPALLEEAIESFKRQRWASAKELIVINDHPEQELSYNDDEVMIVNLKRRLRTLGEKRNLSVALARYKYLFLWDDDDISLPWRIEETMKYLPTDHFFKCERAWLMNRDRLSKEPIENPFHAGAAYTRRIFREVGGYGYMNCGEDWDFENRMKQNRSVSEYWKNTVLPDERLYYIYRWEHGHYHASSGLDYQQIEPEVDFRHYELKPHWKMDYCAEVSRRLEALQAF